MKRVPIWAAALCALLVASTASAQVPLVTVDENGHGNFNGTPIAFTIGPDPTIPTFPPTVTYVLPAQVVPGDVRIFDPAATAAIPSDLVRFVNVGNHGLLL